MASLDQWADILKNRPNGEKRAKVSGLDFKPFMNYEKKNIHSIQVERGKNTTKYWKTQCFAENSKGLRVKLNGLFI